MSERRRVLVVDDSRTQAKQLAIVLHAAGFTVEVVSNGVQALAALRHHRFDLVLTDVLMPEMGGYELCQRIKADSATASLPVILLTTLNDADDIMKGLSSGADNFITKPYDPQSLLERVGTVLGNDQVATETSDGLASQQDRSGATEVKFRFLGKHYGVRASRQQILTFLLSTFEDYASAKVREREALRRDMEHKRTAAVLLENKNLELLAMNHRLEEVNRSLAMLNDELAEAHQRLENSYDDLKREQALREIEARRLETELETARAVQRMLIPEQPPHDIPGFEFTFSYRPAAAVGGDWLQFHHDQLRGKLYIHIGDVTNHGVASALVTAGVFAFFSTLRHHLAAACPLDLDMQLGMLDKVIHDMARQRLFMTFLASELDYASRTMRVANAGHPSPFIVRVSELAGEQRSSHPGETTSHSHPSHKDRWRGIYGISTPGDQLGDMCSSKHFPIRTVHLEPGDVVVWFTDGVSIGVSDHVGERRFIFWLREVCEQPLERIRMHLEHKLNECLGSNGQDDDIAFILARVL